MIKQIFQDIYFGLISKYIHWKAARWLAKFDAGEKPSICKCPYLWLAQAIYENRPVAKDYPEVGKKSIVALAALLVRDSVGFEHFFPDEKQNKG